MALEGSLQDMSFPDLVQIFRLGTKSGILLLISGFERGVVYVQAGRLIDAAVVRGPDKQLLAAGEQAVFQIMQWEEAKFTFRPDTAVASRPVRIVHDSEWLMVEGMRRRRSPIRVLPHQQITMETRLELAPLPTSAESGVNLDLDQWRLLSQVAASEDVRELCAKTSMDAEKAIRIATELVAIGLIDVLPPPTLRPQLASHSAVKREQLVPVMAAVASSALESSAQDAVAERGLLSAIMRRIRGL